MISGFSPLHTRKPGRPITALIAIALALLTLAAGTETARAVTPQEQASQTRARIGEIAGTVSGLRQQIAADNREIDAVLGRLVPLRARAQSLRARLEAKQAELDRLEARLAAERRHLKRVRQRLERALDVLRDQLVSLYMSGTPTVSEVVFSATDWSELASRTGYAGAIQDRNDVVVGRVKDLRTEVAGMVRNLDRQKTEVGRIRDRIAADEREAAAARDRVESQRAGLQASQASRRARIAALEARAGRLEDSLPDLSSDPASSSAPRAPAPVAGQTAKLGADGLAAAPAGAPQAVKNAIAAANAIVGRPYVWGGGHGSFESSGYDCSGAVSYALHGGGLLTSPLDSTGLTTWGEPGAGNWITVYGNAGHAYAVIAGLRWDTSGTGGTGPRWHTDMRSSAGFIARHPSGL